MNVEAQLNSTTSLLHWNRHMIEIRKRHGAFGQGDYHELGGSNPSVLAYVRTLHAGGADGADDVVLCVNNMSRFPPSPSSWTCRHGRVVVPPTS